MRTPAPSVLLACMVLGPASIQAQAAHPGEARYGTIRNEYIRMGDDGPLGVGHAVSVWIR